MDGAGVRPLTLAPPTVPKTQAAGVLFFKTGKREPALRPNPGESPKARAEHRSSLAQAGRGPGTGIDKLSDGFPLFGLPLDFGGDWLECQFQIWTITCSVDEQRCGT